MRYKEPRHEMAKAPGTLKSLRGAFAWEKRERKAKLERSMSMKRVCFKSGSASACNAGTMALKSKL
jgi:hypothetical protein